MKKQQLRFALCWAIVCLACTALNQTVAANLNVGEPRTVRLFYFLPNDRPYRQEIINAMKTGIVEIQSFYAEQMEAHGHGRKTFQIETNDQGNPIVHHVDGAHSSSYYRNAPRPYEADEIGGQFDTSQIVSLVFSDLGVRTSFSGKGVGIKQRGNAVIYRNWSWKTAAHELGHAFGLPHDFRNDAYIMSYGYYKNSLSACAAHFLAVNPYFNDSVPLHAGNAPSVELSSSPDYGTPINLDEFGYHGANYSYGKETLRVRFRVRDPDGLHHVTLMAKTGEGIRRATGSNEVLECRNLSGETDTVVEFTYDGTIPSASPTEKTTLLNRIKHKVYISAVDRQGNRIDHPYEITLHAAGIQEAKVPLRNRSTRVADSIYNVVRDFHDRNVSRYEHITDAHIADITKMNVFDISADSLLKSNDFDGLTGLGTLELRIESGYSESTLLPAGIFKGLISLGSVTIKWDTGTYGSDPTLLPTLPLTIGLTKVGEGQFKVVIPTGAPGDINVPLIIVNGTTNDGADNVTIPAGNVESDVLTVTRDPGRTAAVIVDLERILPRPTGAGLVFYRSSSHLEMISPMAGAPTPVAERTPQVLDAIVSAVPEIDHIHHDRDLRYMIDGKFVDKKYNMGHYVSELHLIDITSLDVSGGANLDLGGNWFSLHGDITELKSGDFDGLSYLTSLRLDDNELSSLPDGIFDKITELTTLNLRSNQLNSLPDGIFDNLTELTTLSLSGNELSSLPSGLFDNLTNLTYLNLLDNPLTSLPEDYFENLPNLETLLLPTSITPPSLPGAREVTPVADRTPQVRDAIVAAVPDVNSAEDVTEAHLTAITELDLTESEITELKPGDFDNLTNLEVLGIGGELRSLPDSIFDNLFYLNVLAISATQLRSLPDDIFDKLINLKVLALINTQLSSLPESIFDNLTNMPMIFLNDNQLSSLPRGIFDKATMTLDLSNNQFSSLPDGIFAGIFDEPPDLTGFEIFGNALGQLPADRLDELGEYTTLNLTGNPVDPLPLTVSLERVGHGQFKAVAPTGAPFELVLPLSVTNGSISGGAMSITIPVGSTESEVFTVTRTGSSTWATSVHIGTLPHLWREHSGYTLVKSADLPIALPELGGRILTPVSQRSPQVRDKIVRITGVESATDVTEAHLASITRLTLGLTNPTKAGDFDGLTGLTELSLATALTSLPAGFFNGFSNLTVLSWEDYQLSSLPTGVLDNLTNLTELAVGGVQLSSLPDGIFDQLTNLTELTLEPAESTSLPDGIFDQLTNLTTLRLSGNQLSSLPPSILDQLTNLTKFVLLRTQMLTLPDGLLSGLSSLTSLTFFSNAADPMPLTVSLKKVGNGQFKAVVPSGAPFDIVLPISITNGSTTSGETSITVLKGTVESGPITITRTAGTINAVTVDIGTLPGLPSDHQGYTLIKSADLPLEVIAESLPYPVNSRTPAVRDAIVAAVPGVNNAADVTEAHLAEITELSLTDKNITSLKPGDFSGLNNLGNLDLDDNQLTMLPREIFDGLLRLVNLDLTGNRLTALPEGVFDELSALKTINLTDNRLATLPTGIFKGLDLLWIDLRDNQLTELSSGVFDGLSSMTEIILDSNRLTALPEGIFDGLSALTTISLQNNQLASLPQGIFSGLSSLTSVNLSTNAVNPIPLTVSLEPVEVGQFKAVAPAGAPFEIVLPLTVTNGSVSGGASSITIPIGSVESKLLTVTRTTGTTAAVTADIRTLPGLPPDTQSSGYKLHQGYELATSGNLPLEVIVPDTATQKTAVNITDPKLRAKIETALGKALGAPISAAEMGTLTSLTAQDSSISNLSGLETATNLTTLKLGNNNISDISPIAGLTKLTELQLWDNQIENLSPLSGLTDLTTLLLWGNSISDISHLTGLTNLTQLQIGNNTISNISPIQNLTNLEWLDIPNNRISDISAVQNLTQLAELFFQNNSVSDLSPLVANTGFDEYTELDVRGNPLSYPSIYTHIPALLARDVYIDFDNRVATAPVKISGDTQQGNTDTTLAQPFVVEVRDSSNAAFEGVSVTFTVTAGGGTLSATNTTTDANGRAQSSLTLGSTAGAHTVRVSVTGITQTTTFNATAATTPVVTVSPIINRTPQVRDAIVAAVPGVNNAADVTETHLAALTNLNLADKSITTLKAGDFDGLTSLKSLYLYNNQLTNLPPNVFSELSSLVYLYLNNNQLTSLPAEVFSGLSSLQQLALHNNRLAVLADEMFRGITTTILLWLQGNMVDPLPLTVSLEKLGSNKFKATVPAGTPFTLVLPLRIANGSISSGTSDLTITAGSVESEPLTVSRTPGTTAAVTVDIGTLPELPIGHKGYRLAKSANLPLTIISAPGNNAPVFSDGASTTRTIAENTAAGENIGGAITATDADNDTLTYSLSGTDAASFSIVSTTGQLQTGEALDFESKTSYTVTVTVSDNNGSSDSITVTINITDGSEPPTTTPESPTLSASTTSPLTEATLHGGVITLNLRGGTFERTAFDIRRSLTVSGITGTDFETFSVVRVSDTQATIELEFEGNMSTNGTLTFNLESDAIANYNGAALTAQISVPAVTEAVVASTVTPLTEATLDESVVTLTLSGRKFEQRASRIRGAVSVSGISGVTVRSFGIDRVSDTKVTVELTFDGDMTSDGTLTFTVEAGAIAGYDGTALTAQLSVSATTETDGQSPETPEQPVDTSRTPTLSVTTTSPLTEATLHGGVITLNLRGGTFERTAFDIRRSLTVSGITGTDFETFSVVRVSDTQATIELEFEGNMSANGTLTFNLESDAIANYDGAALTAQISVPAVTEAVVASTVTPLTEAALDESVVTLTLSGRKFEQRASRIRGAVSVSGISGVTVRSFDIDRVSDTKVTVELTFDGDMTSDGTLTFTVGAGAIAGYDGTALTAQLSVSATTETDGQSPETPEQPVDTSRTPTLSVTTTSPLTEATLNGSIVTLTLSSGAYENSAFDIRRSLTVSGITGTDFETFSVVRVSDTQATIELEFEGNMSANGTLTFNLESDAIANYDGAALTAQISVPAVTEAVVASTVTPLTEATLDESVVTLTLSGRKFEQRASRIRGAVSVSGISGVTVRSFGIDRVSDTKVTVELTFDGDMTSDGTLTFTVGAGAIAGYDGTALTAQLSASANTETDDQTPETPQQPDSTDSRVTFESTTPEGYTRVTLRKTGSVWGVPTKYTSDSDEGTLAYMVLAELMECSFADTEAARQSKVYIKTQSLGRLSNFESETVCETTSST